MDELFESMDTFSSFEEGVDAFGNKFVERWNDLPETGGLVRQKGNSAYSHAILERHTGTMPIRRRTGEIENSMPPQETNLYGAIGDRNTHKTNELLSMNKTGLQSMPKNDALDLGRDTKLYHGLNMAHRGLFRNNGRDQVHGTQFLDRVGPRHVASEGMREGRQEAPHKAGNVDLSSQMSRSKAGDGEKLAPSHVLMNGTDDVKKSVSARYQASFATAAAKVPLGDGDSMHASNARRVTMRSRAATQGSVQQSSWDSIHKPLGKRDTYAEFSSVDPHKSFSTSDSILEEVRRRQYAHQSSVSARKAISESDSERTHRQGERSYRHVQSVEGRPVDVRRDDVRLRRIDEDQPETTTFVSSVAGRAPEVKRVGPQKTSDPRSMGMRYQSMAGANTRNARRPEMKVGVSSANVEGASAALPQRNLNADETTRARSQQFARTSILTNLAQAIRSALGRTENENKTIRARTGDAQQTYVSAEAGENSRKTPDDSIMKSHEPTKVGVFVNSAVGREERDTSDRSKRVTFVRRTDNHANPAQVVMAEARTNRGMEMVDEAGLARTRRVL